MRFGFVVMNACNFGLNDFVVMVLATLAIQEVSLSFFEFIFASCCRCLACANSFDPQLPSYVEFWASVCATLNLHNGILTTRILSKDYQTYLAHVFYTQDQ